MRGEILALFGAALATGIAELLLPDEGKTGTVRLFRFLVSLVILILLLSPFLSLTQKGQALLSKDITIDENVQESYEAVFLEAVQAQSKKDLIKGLYSFLEKEYGIAESNADITVGFDADGSLSQVKIYLRGVAVLQDPRQLSHALSQALNCTVEVW